MLITEICDIYSGFSFPRKPISEEITEYLILESSGLTSSGEIDQSSLVSVTSQQFPMPTKYLRVGDVLIRGKGAHHQAACYLYDNFGAPLIPTSYFLLLRVRSIPEVKLLPEFLSWLLNQPKYQQALSNLAGGTTVKHLTKKRLSALEIDIPPLEKQRVLLELNKLRTKEQELESKYSALKNEPYLASCENFLGGKA